MLYLHSLKCLSKCRCRWAFKKLHDMLKSFVEAFIFVISIFWTTIELFLKNELTKKIMSTNEIEKSEFIPSFIYIPKHIFYLTNKVSLTLTSSVYLLWNFYLCWRKRMRINRVWQNISWPQEEGCNTCLL